MDFAKLFTLLPGGCAQGLIWGIMAIGVYITYKILDLADLTVDGTMATGGVICYIMLANGHSVWIALLCAFAAGMVVGMVTGILHTTMGIPAILSGILTQLGLYSINLRILGKPNKAISHYKYDLVVSQLYIRDVPFYKNTFFVVTVFIIVLVAILYWFFGTELGSSIRATGSNMDMARAQGINTNFCKILGLMLSNGIVALASGLYAQYQGFTDVNAGRGAIVIGLAAVIIAQVLFGRFSGNFAVKLLTVAIGGVIYYLVIQVVMWLGLNTDDLKLLSAIVVAAFLSVPTLLDKWNTKRAYSEGENKRESIQKGSIKKRGIKRGIKRGGIKEC